MSLKVSLSDRDLLLRKCTVWNTEWVFNAGAFTHLSEIINISTGLIKAKYFLSLFANWHLWSAPSPPPLPPFLVGTFLWKWWKLEGSGLTLLVFFFLPICQTTLAPFIANSGSVFLFSFQFSRIFLTLSICTLFMFSIRVRVIVCFFFFFLLLLFLVGLWNNDLKKTDIKFNQKFCD